MKIEKNSLIKLKNPESNLETQKNNLKKNQKHILFSIKINKKNYRF
jgi:hypothetical protein